LETSALEIGRTYFQLTFADRDMTMPGVEPWVYIGPVELEEGGSAYAFQDSVSYVRFGSRLKLKADHEEIRVYFLPAKEVAGLKDVHSISRAVAEAAERAKSLNHPVLPVLKDGWQSAS
jgi:hypothetical protein